MVHGCCSFGGVGFDLVVLASSQWSSSSVVTLWQHATSNVDWHVRFGHGFIVGKVSVVEFDQQSHAVRLVMGLWCGPSFFTSNPFAFGIVLAGASLRFILLSDCLVSGLVVAYC